MPPFSGNPIHRDVAQSAAADLDAPGSLACDVSFISGDSTPAPTLLERECERQTIPQAASLLRTIYENLRGVYDGGSFISHPACLRPIISAAIESSGITIDPGEFESLVAFFDHVSGVMFQHQTLAWLNDCDFQIHLYGTRLAGSSDARPLRPRPDRIGRDARGRFTAPAGSTSRPASTAPSMNA